VNARRASAALLAAVLTSLPALAAACPTCGVANGRNKVAFFVTTVFLSLLPLGLIGAGLLWIVRNSRSFIAGEFRESDEQSPEGGPAAH
jgi:predicted anti-sigma-YlaC factor YlaD